MDFFRTKRALFPELTETGPRPLTFDQATALTRSGSIGEQRSPFAEGTLLFGSRYRICEVLGSGGEGVVYRAYDIAQEHYVALKVLHVEDASAVPTLKREFRFLRDLIHPALVQLHELVVDRECSFFTMSLVEGRNFIEAAKDETTLRSLLGQLANVLSFLHSTGRVHRDIKATNILVRDDGSLTLLDFGVGLNLSRPESSKSGPMGTPRYMAPELLKGEPASPKSDSYSVGVLLFEALTQKHPYPSGRTELGRPPTSRPSEVREDIPPDLDYLCALFLDPHPRQRASIDAVWDVVTPPSRRSELRRRAKNDDCWFTGRAHELCRLEESLQRVSEGYHPVVVFLEAQSGLGKTAFLNRFLQKQKDAVILRSKCSEHELVPHKAIDGVIDDLVEHLLTRDTEDVLELVPPGEAAILVQLFPELQKVPALTLVTPVGPPLGDFRALRQRAYLALAGVLGRLSDEVTLIVAIDDLQWGDVDSGNLLKEVFAGPDRPNCLLTIAYRSEEKHTSRCLEKILEGQFSLTAELVHTTISLQPLIPQDARSLVNHLNQDFPLDPELERRVIDEARGSPLLLTELVSHLRDTSGELNGSSIGISEIVTHRVARLPEHLRTAFELLCCSGRPLPLGLLSSVCGAKGEEILFRLSHLRLATMRRGGQEIEVFHDSMREATLSTLGQRRAALHESLADALVARGGDAAEIARHYDACGHHRKATSWAEVAADKASNALALTQAVDLFRLAIVEEHENEERKLALREKLARALADAGRGAEAAPIFEMLAERAKPAHAVALRRQAAEHYLSCGEAERGVALLSRVQKEVGLSWPQSQNEALRSFLFERLRLRLHTHPAPPKDGAIPSLLEAQLGACRSGWMVGFVSTIHASASSSRYLRLARSSGDVKHLAIGYGMEAIYRSTAGAKQHKAVRELQEKARDLMPMPREGFQDAFLHFVEAECHYMLGNTKASLEPFEQAERALLSHCRNVSWELDSCRIFWSQALGLVGRLNEWGHRLSGWIADAEDRGDMCLWAAAKISQARRSIVVDGDRRAAEALLNEGMQRWKGPAGSVHYFMARFALAFIAAASDDPKGVLEQTARLRREMKVAHMDRVQVPRVHLEVNEGFAAVELAVDSAEGAQRRAHIRRALSSAHRLEQEGAAWAAAFSEQIKASVELAVRPSEQALARLRKVADTMQHLDLRLHRAALLCRVGELTGGDEGRELVETGHAAFADVGSFDWVMAVGAYTPRILPK